MAVKVLVSAGDVPQLMAAVVSRDFRGGDCPEVILGLAELLLREAGIDFKVVYDDLLEVSDRAGVEKAFATALASPRTFELSSYGDIEEVGGV